MAVYVDTMRARRGPMVFCHMWADTPSQLLAMADTIGVNRKWLQVPPKAQWVHMDIGAGARHRAIRAGAIEKPKRAIYQAAIDQIKSFDYAEYYPGAIERWEWMERKTAQDNSDPQDPNAPWNMR